MAARLVDIKQTVENYGCQPENIIAELPGICPPEQIILPFWTF